MTQANYSRNGCGRQILTKLSDGSAYFEHLRAMDIPRKKLNATLIALQADGLIVLTRAGYEITEAGRAHAEELDGREGLAKARVYGASA